jgi:tricorn protease
MRLLVVGSIVVVLLAASTGANNKAPSGYYRFPALYNDTLVFTAEGDLWRIDNAARGGTAERLTTHASEESRAAVSPDGTTLAFSASYEGPTEVYTMPIDGGVPVRQTWEGGDGAFVVGWTPAGEVLYSTGRHAGLPNAQLARVHPTTGERALVPLAQAADGAYDAGGGALFFTRLPFQGSHAKRYKGGTAQTLWKFARGANEAVALTSDYTGTSKAPMPWNGRVYFLSDRDGTMNIWSMRADGADAGKDLRQHTKHTDWDIQTASLSRGRIAYQLGADLRLLDLATNADTPIQIRLTSDFDHVRERWVRAPMEWVTSARLSPTGDRIVMTARGQVFVAPVEQGRFVEATRDKRVRYREGRFMPDGKSLLVLSDESGEVEFWRVPANGVGTGERLTTDGKVLRWSGLPSPDGKLVAHNDKDQQLWILDVDKKTQKKVEDSPVGDFRDLAWSPDSKWLAYSALAANQMRQIFLYNVGSGAVTPLTTDRYDSYSPVWSTDGKWIFFMSDRNFVSVVGSPWGSRQPEPFYDKQTKIYHMALVRGERSPFQPDDELAKPKPDEKKGSEAGGQKPEGRDEKKDEKPAPTPTVRIDVDGIQQRLIEVPLEPGNYNALSTDGKRLYFLSAAVDTGPRHTLRTLAIDNKKPQPETFLEDVRAYELSADGKKVLVRKGDDLFVFDAGAKAPPAAEHAKRQVPLKDWTFRFDPRDEWRQMFTEAWRLHRDYFYDRGMHGLDWPGIRQKYFPLVERVTDRAELSDLVAQMVSELSALHTFVRGGDLRRGQDQVTAGSLGARFARDEKAGGFRVEHIYRTDPDLPEELAPLARPEVNVQAGDVIESVNGSPALSVPDIHQLLRQQADKQVLLRVKPKSGAARDVIVTPISQSRENDLRYDEWEYTRRLEVEKLGGGRIGYVHLRAMGASNMAEWTREFYPVFNRDGLIVDVRHNRGGNIDSWILEKLLRKAWFYWQPRVGNPTWNMQFAFRGHVVVLCNEFTASDGEAFAEGFRRLGLGKVIGTRTWGGEIWLSGSNFLVDRGVATAAETGVYGPEGQWLIEGHGVDPDIVVDNLPHATFSGKDAQLEAAVKFLQDEIKTKPIPVPPAPKYPNKKTTS